MLGGLTSRHGVGGGSASVIIESWDGTGWGREEAREEGGVDDGVTGWASRMEMTTSDVGTSTTIGIISLADFQIPFSPFIRSTPGSRPGSTPSSGRTPSSFPLHPASLFPPDLPWNLLPITNLTPPYFSYLFKLTNPKFRAETSPSPTISHSLGHSHLPYPLLPAFSPCLSSFTFSGKDESRSAIEIAV